MDLNKIFENFFKYGAGTISSGASEGISGKITITIHIF